MTATEARPTTFESLDPRTGDVVGTHPVHTDEEVRAAVARARDEAAWWGALSFDERERHLQSWKGVITRRIAQLAELMHAETGKPHGDAMLECALAIDHLSWAASHAEKVLKRRTVSSGLVMANQAAYVEYQPLGVIGVIGPWNYPVFTPMGSIGYALAAGNAVVFKPSEYTPGVAEWLARSFLETVGRPVLQVVTGYGETGHALCTAGVDKVAFTGSTATGKRVMAACAENLTPVVIEAGGKDALLVDEDADIEAAADAALWGACANAGQTCTGVERVYVHERVYDEFLATLTAQASSVTAHEGLDSQIGPITMPKQLDVIRRHITDALSRGGRAVVGGADAVGDRFVQPTVLVDVPEDSEAVQEETFGPTVTVARVRDMDEAIERANATRYGLGSTVFSKARGMELASRIRSGMTAVNGVITFAAVPSLPFGGVGDSGFGRIHGPDGLKEFTFAKAIARQRFKPLLTLTTFGRTEKADQQLAAMITMLHGRGTTIPK
ncbi:MAG TPA: aldehyde dehydrogenase family protein [Nocardioides sp.]|uniref:aldehyde dehydrogenase family protein n=1 Tax=uncultured Nocardioides sp. TaxID=198441 RepID=UPI000EC75D60|nr:aldehyde dehydrogenase family protein [uncultured Nocardioides sp.]HCB03332.1 aldehyde dehydrogenase [Nocardioides sp.]HRD62475.1 aldehyde dehydrogenase family protein [Nocardioides sp.]HRI95352.1 aldehyde dehydrogenase family protein [Nocardioides sp.]HRK45258.1 aldehyde dehydrogenase family protein [Nocardioides sp.]